MRNDHARAWVPFVLSYVLMALIPTIVCLVFFLSEYQKGDRG